MEMLGGRVVLRKDFVLPTSWPLITPDLSVQSDALVFFAGGLGTGLRPLFSYCATALLFKKTFFSLRGTFFCPFPHLEAFPGIQLNPDKLIRVFFFLASVPVVI